MDIEWWQTFMPKFNGKSLMLEMNGVNLTKFRWSSDAWKMGAGSWFNRQFFHARFPQFLLNRELSINCLECITVIDALKIWSAQCAHKCILILCDNLVTVRVINSGSARNSIRWWPWQIVKLEQGTLKQIKTA